MSTVAGSETVLSLPPSSTSPPGETPATDVQVLQPYGVGIDTHSKFIQVCVVFQHTDDKGRTTVRRKEKAFPTHWNSLVLAKQWVLEILGALAEPDTLRYCIESTGTYHFPVLKAWAGIPSVVNPLLAGASHRKTDVLDARALAHHSITGVWKASFIPAPQAQVLRVLWSRRAEMARRATRAANQLNNIVLRFGFTFGADVRMRTIQAESILSDLIDGRPVDVPGAPPDGLPVEVRPVVKALLTDLRADLHEARAATVAAENYIKARDWPTGQGALSGTALLNILQSVPGVGLTTALTWLSEVTDPRRFENAKQVSAFAGCDPSLKVSAGKVTSYVRRQGNLRLHHALLFAASGLIRRADDPLANWGRSIAGRHKKGGHKKAVGAIARRLACALWEVHRRAEPFSYAKYTLAQELVCPSTPLHDILPERAVRLLRKESILNSHDLAAAYQHGKLAAILGFGETSIAAVKKWVLDKGKYVPVGTANFPGASVPGGSGKKQYTLDPALKFQKKGAKRKEQNEPEPQTHQGSAAAKPAPAKARGPRAAAQSGPGRRTRARRPSGTPTGGEQ